MTDQALKLTTAHSSINTDQPKSAATFDLTACLAKLGKGFARAFWRVSEEHGKADTSSFKGLL